MKTVDEMALDCIERFRADIHAKTLVERIAAALREIRAECALIVRRHDDGDHGDLLADIETEIRELGEPEAK